ncbi:MAG TPA: polysaccharide biosynthesis protein [Caldithrix sp.]|nr:polysaccharide biosynthesis protein [Caldithrix sp.]
MSIFSNLFGRPTPLKRTIFFVVADGIIFLISIYFSYALKFGLTLQNPYLQHGIIVKTIILFLVVKYIIFFRFRLYQFTWSFVGLSDLYNILKASTLSFVVIVVFYFLGYNYVLTGLPKSVILSDYFITFILVGFLRISKRLYLEIFSPGRAIHGKKTLIIGAGGEGEMILRDLRKNNFRNYYPVGILDDDKRKWGFYIHNTPVLGEVQQLEKMIKKFEVETVFIADHSLSLKTTREIYTRARESGISDIKIVPRLYSVTNVEITVKKLEDIRIEDLINRQEIQVEIGKIHHFLSGKKIMITGAAGSIGSEICRQISLFNPAQVILFEIDETEIFFLERKLKESFPEIADKIVAVIGDVRDTDKVHRVFSRYRPDIVFHAAAYKHVPLLEFNPEEAIKVNLQGTFKLCEVATQYGVRKFINISTDKAVKPASVMGASKRLGEYIARAFNDEKQTQFISVRFGNVLGSRGSVVPIFLEQLSRGGPITVTHEDMRRYFMTIPEAVTLVLQAALIGKGGEIMVLDMGEPVYIKQLAEELIRLHGFEPGKEIEIQYTGIRPGEKIFEEILTAEEGTKNTAHERVFIANVSNDFSLTEIREIIQQSDRILEEQEDRAKLKRFLLDIVNKKLKYQ